jgi:hypothetical protein
MTEHRQQRQIIADLQQTAEITGLDFELGNSRSRRAHIHANWIVDGHGVPTF